MKVDQTARRVRGGSSGSANAMAFSSSTYVAQIIRWRLVGSSSSGSGPVRTQGVPLRPSWTNVRASATRRRSMASRSVRLGRTRPSLFASVLIIIDSNLCRALHPVVGYHVNAKARSVPTVFTSFTTTCWIARRIVSLGSLTCASSVHVPAPLRAAASLVPGLPHRSAHHAVGEQGLASAKAPRRQGQSEFSQVGKCRRLDARSMISE